MAKAKNVAPEFKLLNAEMVSAVQSTADGVIQQAESSSEIGAMLHDAGYTSDMLDKKSARTNEALIAEITTAIMYAPRFSAHDRELILNAEAGKTLKTNALGGKTIDYAHEREWRVPHDFSFELDQVEFVILRTYKDMAQFPQHLKDSIGRDKFILMENYETVERLWPVHK